MHIERKTLAATAPDVKDFPSGRIHDLLLSGFVVRNKQRSPAIYERLSLKDILITILLHGGGLRLSEPFHIFTSDVGTDPQNPNSVVVRLYHPEQGAAPEDYVDPISGRPIPGDREEYLRMRWRMQPRTLVEGRFKAGWKDLLLFDQREKWS